MARPRTIRERQTLIGGSVPDSVAALVAEEAQARGMSIASLVRVCLAEVTGLPITRPNESLLPRSSSTESSSTESQEKCESEEKLIA